MAAFAELALCPELVAATEEEGWILPTAIQADAIPLILGGGDICAAAETGSGKTAAFVLPSLQLVHEALRGVAVTPGEIPDQPTAAKGQADWRTDGRDRDVQVIWSLQPPGAAGSQEGASPVHLLCADTDNWRGFRAPADIARGLYGFEVYVHRGLVRVGFGAKAKSRVLGMDVYSFGFGSTGKKSWNGKFLDYGHAFGSEDTVGCVLDRDKNTVSFAVNGKPLGVAFQLPDMLAGTPLQPGVCGKGFEVEVRFANFRYPLEGVKPIGELKPSDSLPASNCGSALGSNKRAIGSLQGAGPLCLSIAPTRDLVNQTFSCYKQFGRLLDRPRLRIESAVGGGAGASASHRSNFSNVDILVGTLDKTLDLVKRRVLPLSRLQMLIIDEADDVVKDQGTKKLLELQQLGTEAGGQRLQTLFFSATLHTEAALSAIRQVAPRACWVDLKGTAVLPDTAHVVVYTLDPKQGLQCDLPLDGSMGPPEIDGVHIGQVAVTIADALKMDSCMLICRTNQDCDLLEKYLLKLGGGRKFSGKMESGKENPYACVVVAGMRSNQERQANLEHFKAGDARFLICTDVAARGIDIKNLPFLIMLTLPDSPEQFFHRVGRVGRAECMGLAICIVSTERERVWYHSCPDRGRGCSDRRLAQEGGCTLWYDEPQILS
ncbi:ATP-dependent RNA helicase DDX1, partial [Cyclospora cayetanensis]|uniref:ATP-dependent RNA helicase n=1 Tax=Cyclospora cayetanensis TaxID=88456 RepID=A0A6P6RYY9_9EIME